MLRFVVHCGLPEGPWDQGQYLAAGGSCVDSGIRSGKGGHTFSPGGVSDNSRFKGCQQCLPTEDHLGPQGTAALSGDTFSGHNWEGASGMDWAEARVAAKQHRMHRTALHGKELSSLKCQQRPS